MQRRYPVGAELHGGGGVHFRVWAPKRRKVEVVFERGAAVALDREPDGYYSGLAPGAGTGALYRFRLDGEERLYPDPASRFQPEGPHGPSQVIDPSAFRWTDAAWQGVPLKGQVLYELHLGTFTRGGTYASAMEELPELASFGVTLVELMPVAEFCGRYGWGYDGVDLFAPAHIYGEPDDLRRFIDRAHSLGLGVMLDVVYNHVGPDGNYLKQFSPGYFTDRHANDWGESINFDGEDAGPVREFFASNAAYWIDEYHLDGLRLDATHAIRDDSPEHILKRIGEESRRAAGPRPVLIIAEDEAQRARLVRAPERGGYGLDGVWNDDFHHAVRVAATGQREAYYRGYTGSPQELISAVKRGYLYQGQFCLPKKERRGEPAFDIEPARFVTFIQNHDQVSNSGWGQRLHQITSAGRYRALTALLLLAPGTPLLFQGQEFAASTPFLFFSDHHPGLQKLVDSGRLDFLGQFANLALPGVCAALPKAGERASFERSVLDLSERKKNAWAYDLHRDLLQLRRRDPVFRQQTSSIDGTVLGPEALALRFFGGEAGDRLFILNLGAGLRLRGVAEPLLAPPLGRVWTKLWASEEPRYGGRGAPALEDSEDHWVIPGQSAYALAPEAAEAPSA